MFISTMRFKSQICLTLLLAGVVLSACQPSQQPTSCCRLEYGLLQPSDLNGRWEPVEKQIQIIQPTGPRYDGVPIAESVRQYLIGNPDQRNKTGVIIHDIYRYTSLAPLLGELDFKISKEEAGTQTVPHNLPQAGLDRQAQCLSSTSSESDDSLLVCIVETRYGYILSVTYFYFDGSTLSTNVEALIKQAISNTDKRIEEIDQHLRKSDI